ncbi:C4-dicarboxylate ABC transporter [Enterovibrio norvegicus FF-162]|uniref:C4-dicarboxylate ABC transporter n=1 Tax=Enterovibrio norvegicus FF-454 TaxID=1185651 RepID=A0A1E5CFA8_9GAMM|nr:sialic acid TRAP transporter substrate-binding protein SiaP [Enterovibrio norvegicus]OEE63792.1 C4-dicarboxylate ABC transporter [Enterovibrio norvegicus FF-454]OEE88525.1 C4-dicarboxylate ABC transporter [Enterovibrio norvegicus FF-162]
MKLLSRSSASWLSNVTKATTLAIAMLSVTAASAADMKLRLSAPSSETDQRAIALTEVFGPGVASFAEFEPHWNASLFKQGTELEAIARGNLDMAMASAQELAEFIPAFSIFAAGYMHRDADHQVAVFNSDAMDPLKEEVEDLLGVKLLSVIYLGRRQLNLRTDEEVKTPADLAGVKLRMPGSDSWQFLGKALGANPTPMAFTEVYTALQTGAVDGQDNPLPTDKDAKFYEVTKQIVLTNHLVDLNYLAVSKKVWDDLTPEQQTQMQKAADDAAAYGRKNQLALEAELVDFFREQGLKVYEPNLEAFRSHVQKAYLESEFSESWPEGMVENINNL